MKAVVYQGNGEIGIEERPRSVILDERDVILEVTLTTICSSDIHIKHGAVPKAVPAREALSITVLIKMEAGLSDVGSTEARQNMYGFPSQTTDLPLSRIM